MMKKKYISRKRLAFVLIILSCFFLSAVSLRGDLSSSHHTSSPVELSSGDSTNYEFLSSVMDDMLNDYSTYGYFPTYYAPSLQATYFAVYSHYSLGSLNSLNTTEIIDYIMDHYDEQNGYFLDDYAIRFLDTEFDFYYLPLNTLLEVNCYAILSLQLLNRLDLIDNQSVIDFIWSCFNSNEGAFIGQPFHANLHPYFRIPTLDNTYYAVKVLDLLLETWNDYSPQRSQLITFIESCQMFIQEHGKYGGFKNDRDENFNSLRISTPNMLASFYALKTLDSLNALGTINTDAFHEFLEDMYNENNDFFEPSWFPELPTHGRPFATSIGLDLSLLTGYPFINETGIVTYLMSIRNAIGVWKTSVNDIQFELIDSFQVLRSLKEAGHLSDLSTTEKNEIMAGLTHFQSYRGYSNLPKDYMSTTTLNSIARSFKLFNRETDLEIQEIFLDLEDAYISDIEFSHRSFYGYTNTEGSYMYFRVYPIEFYNMGNYSSLDYTDYLFNHKFVYNAITTLNDLYKLDDFGTHYDLYELLNQTRMAQIINPTSTQFGAFLPNSLVLHFGQECQDASVFLDQSFYAIRVLEYLGEYLNEEPVEDLLLDPEALKVYVFNTLEAPGSYCYSMPRQTTDVTTIVKNTYFASYILTALDSFTQDPQKIKNYVIDHIDYSDMENIYYSYLLDQLLGLDIAFSTDHVQSLVQSLYSEDLHAFYQTTDHTIVDQQILYWMCEMATHDKYRYTFTFDEIVEFDSYTLITATIENLILESLGEYGSLKFESTQLGTYSFTDYGDGEFRCNVLVPFDEANYPVIYANISRYEFSAKQETIPIIFNTTYEFTSELTYTEKINSIEFSMSCSLETSIGVRNIPEGEGFIEIFYEGSYLETEMCSAASYPDHTLYSVEYEYSQFGNYSFDLYVNDGLNSSDHFLGSVESEHSYELISEVLVSQLNTTLLFYINASMMIEGIDQHPFPSGSALLRVYREGIFIQEKTFIGEDRDTYTHFHSSYTMVQTGNYSFEMYLNDGMNPTEYLLYEYFAFYGNDPHDPDDPDPSTQTGSPFPYALAVPVILLPAIGSCTVIISATVKIKQLKFKK